MADIYVAHSGDDQLGAGTQVSPYRTIQCGLDNASAADTVLLVNDGVYVVETLASGSDGVASGTTFSSATATFQSSGVAAGDNVFIAGLAYKIASVDSQTQLTLTAAPGDGSGMSFTVGDQEDAPIALDVGSSVDAIITLTSQNTPNPATIDASGASTASLKVLNPTEDAYAIRYLNVLCKNDQQGIIADGASKKILLVDHVTVTGALEGIVASHNASVVRNCHVVMSDVDNAVGIEAVGGDGIHVTSNRIIGGSGQLATGVKTTSTGSAVVRNNVISDFAGMFGMGIMAWPMTPGSVFINNTIDNVSGGYGLSLANSNGNCTAINNCISNCLYGIGGFVLEGGYNNVFNCGTPYAAGYSTEQQALDLAVDPKYVDAPGGDYRILNPLLKYGNRDSAGQPWPIGAIHPQEYRRRGPRKITPGVWVS